MMLTEGPRLRSQRMVAAICSGWIIFSGGWTQPSPEAMSVFTQPGHSVVTLIPCAASSR